jgi:hypothetical protein
MSHCASIARSLPEFLNPLRDAFSGCIAQYTTKFQSERIGYHMTIISTMRAGALAMVLAAGTLVGCSSLDQTMTAQGTRLVGSSGISTGAVNYAPYSGPDSEAATDAAMTSQNGGD